MTMAMIILFSSPVSPWVQSSELECWYLGLPQEPPEHAVAALNGNGVRNERWVYTANENNV